MGTERGSVLNRRRSGKVNRKEQNAVRRNASDVVRRKNTELLIDGYNLMHVTRFKPSSKSSSPPEGELRRCREGLLALLASQLPKHHHPRVSVVFDSQRAPRGLPDQSKWGTLDVVFAREFNSADDLIIQLIGQHTSPKQLVVISSDHRVQVVAQRRKAITIDSDVWFDALLDYSHVVSHESETKSESMDRNTKNASGPEPELTAQELAEFRDAMAKPLEFETPADGQVQELAKPEFENPFPKGYFDDMDE